MKHEDKGMVLSYAIYCNEKHPTSFKFYPRTNTLWVHVDMADFDGCTEAVAWSFDFGEELDQKYFESFKEFVRTGKL